MNPIETSRLQIRPFADTDLDCVTRLLDECFGQVPGDERRQWLEWSVRNYPALAKLRQPPYGDYAIVVKDSAELVGSVGLVPSFGPFGQLPIFRSATEQPSELYRPEMGLFWAVAAKHRRAGFATEAAKAMAAFAFESLCVERLVATTERDNAPSVGVMRKLGMAIETNPQPTPKWFQVIGVLFHPAVRRAR